MASPSSYLLCATPRTGSTWLCSLLSSTGVLGRPESYFRKPDEAAWATRLDVPVVDGRARDYTGFVRAVRVAGTTANGVFAARIMWGSLDSLVEGSGSSRESDLAALSEHFGPLTFVFLTRENEEAQAVSWARAEQSGYWHEGDAAVRTPDADIEQMVDLAHTIRDHNAAWRSWFERNGITSHEVTYEQLVQDPREAVLGVAAAVGVAIPLAWKPASPHRRQSDETNVGWEAMLRAALRTGSDEVG